MQTRHFIFITLMAVFFASCENPLFIQHTGLHKVEFSTNGGSSVESMRTNKIKSAPQTTKENCEFEGWYESSDFREAAVVFPFDVREDVTLYAKWLQKYVVSFDSDGGTTVAPMTAHTLSAPPPAPKKDGFTFGGWCTDGTLAEMAVFPLELASDMTLYAKWLRNFTVTFDMNGGTAVAPVSAAIIETLPKPTKGDDYEFGGWYESPSFVGEAVAEPYAVVADTTLYAKWHPTYLVTLETNGGSVPERVLVEKGGSFVVSANTGSLAKSGYAFTNWSTSADGTSGQTYAAGYKLTPSGNLTLYAQWGKDYAAMVDVAGGTFKMGNPDSTARPTITLSGFRMAKYELTYELWLEVYTWAVENGYTLSKASKGYASNDDFKSFVPAMNFSWNMACVWLNAYSEYKGLEPVYYRGSAVWRDNSSTSGTFSWDRTKNGFRLPTECEWEYAAGGGNLVETRTIYSGSNNIDEVAWYKDSSGDEAHPVGTKKQNQLGICDMSGSVREWCYDYYASYGTGELTNPIHGSGDYKVHRGGGLKDGKNLCTIYYRQYYIDYYYPLSEIVSQTGIRVAQNAAQ